MFKTLLNLVAGVVLLLGGTGQIQAAVVTNTTDQLFNAVNEVSSTLRVNAAETQLSIFVSGTYENINTVVLQREVGSPGSGAFEDVLTVTNGTANARVTSAWTTGPNPSSYRLKMTAAGTGAVVAYLTDHPVTARTWVTNVDQIVFFDEFLWNQWETNADSTTIINDAFYVTQDSDVGGGTVAAVTLAIQEGGVTLIGGTTAENGVCMSAETTANFGALVSDGTMSFEVRLRTDTLDGKMVVLLASVACVADVVPLVDIDSGVVSQVDAGSESLAGFVRQDEGTDTDDWQAISAIADAEGANALEVPLGTATAVDTYVTLRIEIASTGDAYWYIAGSLVHAEPLAVTTTARLIPLIQDMETALNVGAVTMIIDYWEFVVARPSS